MGKVSEVTSILEFNRLVGSSKLTVVDFYATWCGPCKAIAPEIERMSTTFSHVQFIKVDVDKAQVGFLKAELTFVYLLLMTVFNSNNLGHCFKVFRYGHANFLVLQKWIKD